MPPNPDDPYRRFLRLFTANESAIRAFVRRLVPSRSDADDILQDTSIVLWEKFSEFREDGDFLKWAFGVAKFEVLAWRRDKARDRLVLDESVVEQLATEAPRDEDLLSRQREALEACLARVKPKDRSLLVKAYQSGSRVKEVARKSGRSETGFYQWLHRMRGSLLECVRRNLKSEGVSQ